MFLAFSYSCEPPNAPVRAGELQASARVEGSAGVRAPQGTAVHMPRSEARKSRKTGCQVVLQRERHLIRSPGSLLRSHDGIHEEERS